MYKHILFDADNTLLDFDEAQCAGFKVVLAHYSITYTDDIYTKYMDTNHSLWSAYERGEATTDYVQTERFNLFF